MDSLSKTIVAMGVVLIALGVGLRLMSASSWLGKLPGDIFIKKENFTFYFPIVTCLLLSMVLSFLFYIWH